MITATLVTNSTITNMTGYSAFAEGRVGGDGDPWGLPEIVTGTSSTSNVSGHTTWDGDMSDGFDSGYVPCEFDAKPPANHSVDWMVDNADPGDLQYTSASYTNVFKVDVRAMAQTSGKVAWRSLTVAFYKNGVVTDSYSVANGPTVDFSTQTGTVQGEQYMQIVSDKLDNDSVVVTGEFLMSSPEGVYPGGNDLAAQIFVFSNTQVGGTPPGRGPWG